MKPFKQSIQQYIKIVKEDHNSGTAGELTYRSALETLMNDLLPGLKAQNESSNEKTSSKPDMIVRKNRMPVGHVETKDVGDDLDSQIYQEQFERYIKEFQNLIITNYLHFRFYRNHKLITEIQIAGLEDNIIKSKPDQFQIFKDYIKYFGDFIGQSIENPKELAEVMASKTRMLQKALEKALTEDKENSNDSRLLNQYKDFKKVLLPDLKTDEFADLYAQTLTYGFLAARLTGLKKETFSRIEVAEAVPESNPFLREFFSDLVGSKRDERLNHIIDDLVRVFNVTNPDEIMKKFKSSEKGEAPVFHFYETFLTAYNPELRKSRGVYYTPPPVVNFIVRAVDKILENEFELKGLDDSSKIINPHKNSSNETDEITTEKVHKVQILDPAAGTGTFLGEVIKLIHEKIVKAGQKGTWDSYVDAHLMPRLNGFEIMMAPYAMAHLQLDLLLKDSDYTRERKNINRFHFYLANALEEKQEKTASLWELGEEVKQANEIKSDTPVMVVLGNPPYSGISSNMSNWINNLIEKYKYVDRKHFGEKKHWLHDDYVKFIRYGQYHIDRTGEGVLAYINNHSFLDNPTFRGMRWNLLQSFDKIYIVNLHGNSRKKEANPDGSADENVFSIQQGVSINLFIKTGKKKSGALARVFYHELYGLKENKYEFLWNNDLNQIDFKELTPVTPYYFFVPKNWENEKEYNKGFSINDLFGIKVTGIITSRDKFVIDTDKKELLKRISDFTNLSQSDETIRAKYFKNARGGKYLFGDSRSWKMAVARKKIENYNHANLIQRISYRPFDHQFIYYHPDMVDWGRENFMQHFLNRENVGLLFKRGGIEEKAAPVFITKYISDNRGWSRPGMKGIETSAPLYIYLDDAQTALNGKQNREPNFNMEIVQTIAESLKLDFTPEKEKDNTKTFNPCNLLDYIYAVLHSPKYRQSYNEFLKIDFPRVPYPTDTDIFWELVKLGEKLRELHLLEGSAFNTLITTYPESGNNLVTNRILKNDYRITDSQKRLGKVWINRKQYFGNVPETVWNAYIGGYQPAQKWLKDRKGRQLSSDDIQHYQKIIVALKETEHIMTEIDEIIEL